MTRDEFERCLLLYGADLARWPEDSAAAARTLLGSDPTARILYEEITVLDTALNVAAGAAPVGSAEIGRVLAGLERKRRHNGPGFGQWRLAATGLAMAASVAGFAVGFFGDAGSPAPEDELMTAIDGLELQGSDMDMWLLL